MSDRLNLSRRSFIQIVSVAGASLVIGSFPALACAAADGKDGKGKRGVTFEPNALVKVDPDSTVTVTIICPDAGQGSRTVLAMLIADEMDVDWHKVKIVQAQANGTLYKYQGIGGSSTVRSKYNELRKIGAAARMMLVAAAAKTWNVPENTLKTANGKVLGPDGKSISYGDLTATAAGMPLASNSPDLKSKDDFQLIGKGATRVDNPDVVTGKAMYGLDVKVPGMVYAVVERAPAFGASVKSFDDSAARKVPGVIDVVQIGRGVAVVGKHTWAAISGRKALKVEWDLGPNADLTTAKISARMKAAVTADKPVPDGAKAVKASMEFPYLAHATMEPINAVADVKGDQCTVWTGTQQPNGAQQSAAKAAGLSNDQVTVNVMLLGGGFGRRLSNEYVEDAVQVSKAIKKPVKLMWTREDDMKHDNYRTCAYASFQGAVDASGNPVLWNHQSVQTNSRGGRSGLFYDFPDGGIQVVGVRGEISTGAWRSVENTIENVANECFVDEMAHAGGIDPFEFRRKHLADDRLKNVLEVAAQKAGWGTPLPAGHGRGIACFKGYGSYAAHVIELSVEGGQVKLHRAVCVVDCGLAVNPKGVEAQMQGACTDGLSTALRAAITIDKGGVVENSWPQFRWMTLDAMPKVEVTILQTSSSPGGMGEVGYPSVAPAVANAIFAATGKRVRKFPIKLDELA